MPRGRGRLPRSQRCRSPLSTGAPSATWRPASRCPTGALEMLQDGVRRDPAGRDGRSAGARQPARGGHPARDALPARPLRELPARAAPPRAALPAQGRPPAGRRLRRVPREHRGPLRDDGRQLQEGHARRGGDRGDLNTRKGVERIIRHAFEFARATGRTKRGDGGQVERAASTPTTSGSACSRRWRRSTPRSRRRHLYVDNLALQMVREPSQFEVIVTSQHVRRHRHRPGGRRCRAGWAWPPPGTSIPGRLSLFEPVHGSAPPLAGKNVANPMGAILTAGLMLEHLGLGGGGAAHRGRGALGRRERADDRRLGGTLGTREVGDAIAGRLRA